MTSIAEQSPSFEPGCWLQTRDWGISLGEAIIKLAIEHGWLPFDLGYNIHDLEVDTAKYDDEGIHYHDCWNDAEQFLANLAPEGYWIGSNENGDFGMWEVEQDLPIPEVYWDGTAS